ncbi:hypothetical protein V5O48_008882 [Marasmius crinis-equi]|uniref:Uncharacterized protein n=1 Tax=Marasmius crinis-equi TaxID=585013 RepID=A0ABR3FCU1_9AGAR
MHVDDFEATEGNDWDRRDGGYEQTASRDYGGDIQILPTPRVDVLSLEDSMGVGAGVQELIKLSIRRWRQLSMNLPELWTNVDVDLFTIIDTFKCHRTGYEILREVLRRTASQKLRVTITACNTEPPMEQERLLLLLRSTRSMWSSLTLEGVALKEYGNLWQLYPVPGDSEGFTSLEEVDSLDMSYWEHDGRLMKALERAPKLRAVAIYGGIKGEPLFEWQSLAQFSIPPDSGDWWAHRLALCTRLTTLVFVLSHRNDPVDFQGFIHLNTLRTLRLEFAGEESYVEDPFNVCEILEVPGLERLEIDTDLASGTDFESIIGMLERSAPAKLKSVSIEDVLLTDVTIVRLLEATPGVTHLNLAGHMLPYLLNAIMSGKVLPNIEHLTVGTPVYDGDRACTPLPGLTRTAVDHLVKLGTPTGTLKSVRILQALFTEDISLRSGRAAVSTVTKYDYSDRSRWVAVQARKRTKRDETPRLFERLFDSMLLETRASPVSRRTLNENIELFHYVLTTIEECKTGLFKNMVNHFASTAHAHRVEHSSMLEDLIDLDSDTGEVWTYACVKHRMLALEDSHHSVEE